MVQGYPGVSTISFDVLIYRSILYPPENRDGLAVVQTVQSGAREVG